MLLEGKPLASEIRARTAAQVDRLRADGIAPTLAVVFATADEGSAWYVRSLVNAGEKTGLAVTRSDLGPAATEAQIAETLTSLDQNPAVHGIILQMPLPDQVDVEALASLVRPHKDVDGINPLSAGRLVMGQSAFAPATASAVLELLSSYRVELEGAHAVVVGRSNVVGKPVAQLLLARNATVTICHSRTQDLEAITRTADVLVAAVGQPNLIGRQHVKPGAVIVDVGTTQDASGKLVGDVDTAAVEDVAAAVSPVPGGVGPVTTALLLRNTVDAAAALGGAREG